MHVTKYEKQLELLRNKLRNTAELFSVILTFRDKLHFSGHFRYLVMSMTDKRYHIMARVKRHLFST